MLNLTQNKDTNSEPKKRFDPDLVRQDFPILSETIHNKALVYFDNAASTQKPNAMIDALSYFLKHDYANVHRGIHTLSQRSTQQFEDTRKKVQQFIHAKDDTEIIFLRGVTEASNLLAQTFSHHHVQKNDEIIVTEMEHHSNIVPWQMLAEKVGAHLKIVPINEKGELDLNMYASLLNTKTKVVALPHISNALGTINPIKKIIDMAHAYEAWTVIDGAQSVAHEHIDVQQLDCDFFMFSGHKLYGPTGIGVMYGKKDLLNTLPPYHGGGEMIDQVTLEKSTYKLAPARFEAGTPDIMGAIALGASIDYFNQFDLNQIKTHEDHLLQYTQSEMQKIPDLSIVGTAEHKSSIVSFYHTHIHANDIATLLDQAGIAVRSGHHCAQPAMEHFNINSSCRVSFAMYNTQKEIDYFIQTLKKCLNMLG